jgi:elongation factor Ts
MSENNSSVSMDLVKQLRDDTGVAIMQCKKALEECGGDIEKAKVMLRKISSQAAQKKADRVLGAGVIQAYIHTNKTVAGVVALSCETDFVARNPEFIQTAYDIAMHVAALSPQFIKKEEVSDADIAAAKSVFEEEVNTTLKDKPAEMREKILQGKIDAYLKDKVLLEQPFVKNGDITVQTVVDQASQKFGEKVEITRAERIAL